MNQDALLEYVNNLPQTDEQDNYTVLSARKNHPRSYIIWTVQEDTLLIQLYSEKTSIAFIARLLKRSSNAIIIRVKALSIVEKQKKEIPEIDLLSSIQDKKLDDIHSVICYWRNSLADADKMGLLAKDMEQAEQFPFELFQQGQLPQEKIEQFFEEAEKKLKENLKHSSKKSHLQSQDVKLNKLQVIIAPYIAIKNYHHGQQIRGERESNEIFPLWMIANLSRTGDLTPDEDIIYPWIERRCLFPNGERDNGLSYPIIGDVSDVDAFYAQYSILLNKPLEWEKLFTFANDLFLSLCNKESNIFSNQNYSLIKTGFVLPTDSIKEPCRNIIATYDQHLLNQKNIPNLLSKFCSFKDQPYCSDQQPEKCFLVSSQHLGQMQKNYPLSASQRKSIGYFSDLENNEIVTIHGPPGTGKTTLLQSVIASNWVEAACDKKYPPIQVAASTNNLAVTNILDRLNEAGDECARWLPDFKTCGLYLAPAHQVEQAKKNNYQFRIRGKDLGSIEQFYTTEYNTYAKGYFLEKFNNFYQQSESDLIKCQNFIHEQLLLKRNFLRETIHFIHDFHHAEKILIQRYGSLKAIDTLLLENNHALLINNKNLEKIKELRISWLLYKTTTIKWTRFFSWLPFIKQLLIERIQLFTLQHDFFSHVITTIHEVEEMLTKKMNTFLLQHNQLKEEQMMLNSSKASYLKILAEKISLEKKLGFALNTDHPLDFFAPNNVLCQLDQTLRYDLFVLAMHYWEIQWLFESEHISSLSYTRKDRKKYWNIQAMLTPCFVTTLHSGPGFFQYKTDSQKFETLYDLIDLLIIDEAGQVMPAIAGAMISIAKRLLLVGDTNQIEPIFLLTESIDFANTKKFGLCKNELDYESLKDKGILCSGDASIGHAYGNLIIAGQRKSKFHLKEEIYPGLLLKEHRRCAKEIISYCNELCYNNQLIPMTLEKYSCYPRIGYFHIKGHEEKIGSTRSNSKEALTIVHWIKKNQQKILEMCHEEFKQNEQICLNDCIGIVTPFVAQGRKIRLALNNYGLKIDKVGTVHSLQGAERPIIIFSPVYTACKTHGTFFFDKSVNMLNVAVSRAKRSFLVFGDKDIFDISEPTKPSGLLAKYLFSSKKNEIFDEE